MELILLFTTAFVVAFSGAMMPGPLLTANIIYSAEKGFWAGPLLILGHGLLEAVLILALLAGAASFLVKPAVTTIIALAGGLFLICFGLIMLRDVAAGKIQRFDEQAAMTVEPSIRMHPVLAGIIISVTNPYWIIWWVTIGIGYLALALKSGALGITAFFSGHILADLLWYAVIAYVVSKGTGFLSPRIYKSLLILCGLFMLGLGGYFTYLGVKGLPQMYTLYMYLLA